MSVVINLVLCCRFSSIIFVVAVSLSFSVYFTVSVSVARDFNFIYVFTLCMFEIFLELIIHIDRPFVV